MLVWRLTGTSMRIFSNHTRVTCLTPYRHTDGPAHIPGLISSITQSNARWLSTVLRSKVGSTWSRNPGILPVLIPYHDGEA